MYLAVPVLLYASERLIRAFRPGAKAVKILKVNGKFCRNSSNKKTFHSESILQEI